MEILDDIAQNYKRLPIHKLIALVDDYKELSGKARLLLEQELIERGETEKAAELRQCIEGNPPKSESLKKMPVSELKQMIEDRLNLGEPIESIHLDLKDNGIDMLDIPGDEDIKKRAILNYMTMLKSNNITEGQLLDDVQETFLINREETEALDTELKKSGKAKTTASTIIAIVAVLLAGLVFITTGQLPLPIGLIALAAYLGYKGNIQKR